eukprot:3560945-Prymnesium_polylepis.1
MSMLTSTVWYTGSWRCRPQLVRWPEPTRGVGGGSRGYKRRVPSPFCGRSGPGVGGRLGAM